MAVVPVKRPSTNSVSLSTPYLGAGSDIEIASG